MWTLISGELYSDCAFLVSDLAVESFVESGLLDRVADANRRDLVDRPEHAEGERERPDRGEENRAELDQEEAWIAVKEAIHAVRVEGRRGEETKEDNPKKSADAVNAPDVERVVPLELVLESHRVIADHSGRDPDETGNRRRDVAGGGSDGGQAGHGAGEESEELRLLRAHPIHGQPGDGGERGGDVSVEKRHRGDGIDAELTACIESIPAKPQEARAESNERNAVGPTVEDSSLADVKDRGESGDAGDVVDDDAAGEVENTQLCQDPASPHHVNERKVDEQKPPGQECHVRLEGDAAGEGAGDQGGRDDCEHHLVGAEDDHRDRVVRAGQVQRDVPEKDPVEIADDPEIVGPALEVSAETHREPAEPPEDGRPAHGDETLDHDGQDVFPADEAAVEEGQARRHQHDQAAAEEHEPGISGVEVKGTRHQYFSCGAPGRKDAPSTREGFCPLRADNTAFDSRGQLLSGRAGGSPAMESTLVKEWFRVLGPGGRIPMKTVTN